MSTDVSQPRTHEKTPAAHAAGVFSLCPQALARLSPSRNSS